MRLTFDYTAEAKPLSVRQIKENVDDYWLRLNLTPDKIVMWQHQLDWIVKQAGGAAFVAPHLAAGIRIWSIPLEVRKP